MGHFDQFPPTSPSVGCRLGQGTFAEAIRQLPRRAENGNVRPQQTTQAAAFEAAGRRSFAPFAVRDHHRAG